MSDVIRALGMKMSHDGTCRRCGQPRDKGTHALCDLWPCSNGIAKGFHYVANSKETTIEEFKNIAKLIAAGESDQTPVRFEIRITAVKPPAKEPK